MCCRKSQGTQLFVNNTSLGPQKSFSKPSISKKEFQSSAHKVRIIQNNLVFANGLPLEISNFQTLASSLYFGRYGYVQKIIFSSTNQFRKNSYTQAYVTYSNPIEASLAIMALDGFELNSKPLKVSYGTTKYCAYFIQGYQCINSDCYYLHQMQPQNQLAAWDSKEVFKKQTTIALATVISNIQYIVANTFANPYQTIFQGFPTINQTIDLLWSSSLLSSDCVQIIKNLRTRYTEQANEIKQLTGTPTESQLFQQIQNYWVEDQTNSRKNNSFSTLQSLASDVDEVSVDSFSLTIQQKSQSEQVVSRICCQILTIMQSSNFLSGSKMDFVSPISEKSITQSYKISDIMKKQLNK